MAGNFVFVRPCDAEPIDFVTTWRPRTDCAFCKYTAMFTASYRLFVDATNSKHHQYLATFQDLAILYGQHFWTRILSS